MANKTGLIKRKNERENTEAELDFNFNFISKRSSDFTYYTACSPYKDTGNVKRLMHSNRNEELHLVYNQLMVTNNLCQLCQECD